MSKKNSARFFLKSGIFIFIASNLGAVLDSIFKTYLIRNLSSEEFGLFVSLFFSFSIVFLFSTSLDIFVTKKITEKTYHRDFHAESMIWFQRSFIIVLLFNLPIIFLIIVFRNFILEYYQFDNIKILFYFLIFYFFYMLTTPFGVFLKGIRSFKNYYFCSFCFEISKVALLFFFIYSGFSLAKAYFALILATIIYVFILAFFFFYSRKNKIIKKINFLNSLKKYYKEYLYIFLFLSFIVALTSLHLIVVRFIFSPEDSGKYGVIVMIRNTIFIITSPLISLIFPFLVDLEKNNERFKMKWLFFLFLIKMVIALVINLLFYFFKERVFANKYNNIGSLVILSSFNGVLLAMIQYICYYYLVKIQSFKKYFLLLLILMINVFTVAFFSSNLTTTILINGVFFIVIFFYLAFFLWIYLKKNNSIKN